MRVMLKPHIPSCGTKCYWCGVHIWPPVGLGLIINKIGTIGVCHNKRPERRIKCSYRLDS